MKRNLTEEIYKMRKLMSYDSKKDFDNVTSYDRLMEEKLVEIITEQSDSRKDFLDKLGRIDPMARKVVETNKKVVKVSDKYVLSYVEGIDKDGGDTGAGTLYMYFVGVSGGLPYIVLAGTAINRVTRASSPNDIHMSRDLNFNSLKDYPNAYNDVWNSLDEQQTQEVINGALQFISKNQEKFKKAFHRVTRSGMHYKYFWNDNPGSFNTSQYGMWRSKAKSNAQKVIDLVQDDLLIKNILFITKNWRSDGEYPELTIPPAVK